MSKETAIARIEDSFPVLAGAEDVLAVVEANLGGEQISPFDLEQIKVPGGGSMSWQLSTGEEAKEVSGIVIHHKLPRGRWEGSIEDTGGGQPPVCVSEDSLTGSGDPGGDCLVCPWAQFGSAEKGTGQACKQRRLLFIVREGQFLPSVVSLPATSLKPSKQYLVSLVSRGTPIYAVMTRITLEPATNSGGIKHARAKFAMGDRLSPEQAREISRYAEKLRPLLDQVRIEHTDAAAEGVAA